MKISIVTVCYNAAPTIRDALLSVASQRLGDGGTVIEHLAVDGGSTDGTAEILRTFAEEVTGPSARSNYAFRWMSEQDDGLYDAMNKGIRLATGEVVGILNADDVLADAEVIAKIAEALASGVDSVFGNVRFVKELGGRTLRVCFARFWRPWMLQWGYMPPHPALFIRRQCFTDWGTYVPDRRRYRIAADYELLIRFFRVHRMSFRYVPVCTTVMRTGGVSTKDAQARRQLNAEIVMANRANGYHCWLPMLLPKYLVKIWEFLLPRLKGGR